MANTSLSLGTHWKKFVKREIASGRYASANEVIRAALREPEERGKRLKALQDHLAEGARQSRNGELVEVSVEEILKRAKKARRQERQSLSSYRLTPRALRDLDQRAERALQPFL